MNTKLLTKHYAKGRAGERVLYIVVHHNAGNLSVDQIWDVWQTRRASAHYQVTRDGTVGQLVRDEDTAWHAGNSLANRRSIGVEHANGTGTTGPLTRATLEAGAELVAELCVKHKLGRPQWLKNVYPHSHFSPTACPGHLAGSQNSAYMLHAKQHYDKITRKEAPVAAAYVRPVKDAAKHPISAVWRKPGKWAAGYHTGVDIACPAGTPVYATIGGDARTNSRRGIWGAQNSGPYGIYVIINDNQDGSDWAYCHLSKAAVKDGQKVKTGQLIGYSGNTGNSTGPHLHLERRPRYGRYGTDRNPNLWADTPPKTVAAATTKSTTDRKDLDMDEKTLESIVRKVVRQELAKPHAGPWLATFGKDSKGEPVYAMKAIQDTIRKAVGR